MTIYGASSIHAPRSKEGRTTSVNTAKPNELLTCITENLAELGDYGSLATSFISAARVTDGRQTIPRLHMFWVCLSSAATTLSQLLYAAATAHYFNQPTKS